MLPSNSGIFFSPSLEEQASINKMITKLPSYLTIIIISHSLEFLDSCDKVYNLVNGKLKVIDNK